MNPILLKPSGNGRSQVIVNGRLWKTLAPRAYHEHVPELRRHVRAAYEELSRRFEVIVIEGAGSVSELNLRATDLVNLDLVVRLGAPWMLVADIERGGVFASVLGTIGLLTPDERALLRGFAINRFRGDVSLFEEGARTLETRTGSHCFGIFPYAADITIDAEDSLALDTEARVLAPSGARLAIVRLPCLSNATDFRLLPWADWIQSPPAGDYDFIVLPGTKNSIGDLRWLHSTGLSAWMLGQRRRGATIVGICGGYQMMGRRIADPLGVEGGGSAVGLGLLPVVTVMKPEKRTEVRPATTRAGTRFTGYEIHMGETSYEGSPQPFARFDDGTADGACLPGAIGTYLHGALENPDVCAELFGVPIPAVPKRDHYARLAAWLERHGREMERLLAR